MSDVKKPWDSKAVNGSLIFMGIFLISFLPAFLLPITFLPYVLLIQSINSFAFGIYLLWILYKFWPDMKKKRDKISYPIGGIFLIVMGSFYFLMFPVFSSLMTLETMIYFEPLILVLVSSIYWLLSFMAGLLFIVAGIELVVKNHRSWITRLFFLSFASFGIGWIFFALYNRLVCNCQQQLIFTYTIFYVSTYFGMVILAHACRNLITPNSTYFHPAIYLISFISYVITILLLLTVQKHIQIEGGIYGYGILYVTREHSIVFSIAYLTSLFLPLGYSILKLSSYPDWLTEERRKWIKRVKVGLVLLIPFFLSDALAGMSTIKFLEESVSPYNPLPRLIFILIVSIFVLFFSVGVISSGSPDVNKWFFEEVKFRAALEVEDIRPELNLASIWGKFNDWEKDHKLSPREMDEKKLQEYVQKAKTFILDERTEMEGIIDHNDSI